MKRRNLFFVIELGLLAVFLVVNSYAVAPNSGKSPRKGTLNVAGQTLIVTQAKGAR